jgi:hypothetical protein
MMSVRQSAPVIGAAVVSLVCLIIGTHTSRSATEQTPLPTPVAVRVADVAQLGAEVSAPLFAPSRSLVAVGAPAATPPAPPPQLLGIVLGGGHAVALVKNAAGDTLMVHAGETVDGWTIAGIAPRQIVIARDGAQHAVALEFGTAKMQASGGPVAASTGSSSTTASPSFDGLAAASRLGLPQANIPLGSPLAPPR